VLKDLIESLGAASGLGIPLHSERDGGTTIGAIILVWYEHGPSGRVEQWLCDNVLLLSETMQVINSHAGETLSQKMTRAAGTGNARLRRIIVVASVVVSLALLLALPMEFQLGSECVVRPVSSRHVVSRFDGVLQEVLVKPGDEVNAGQLLARLDGRDTDLQLMALAMEKNKAAKMRDHHLATGNTPAAQISRLDEQRIDQQIGLLHEVQKHQVVRTPVTGVVLAGDLKRTEGAPVSRGQSLFEVAPLERIEIELAVAEDDISFISKDQEVSVRFDAYPEMIWPGRVERIIPRSLIQDNSNVFIATMELENNRKQLRPGMRGNAKIVAGKQSIGWQIFRKPRYTLLKLKDRLF
jgi:multidrug efflux pump subunit AcrA (membrane-fusion protein)